MNRLSYPKVLATYMYNWNSVVTEITAFWTLLKYYEDCFQTAPRIWKLAFIRCWALTLKGSIISFEWHAFRFKSLDDLLIMIGVRPPRRPLVLGQVSRELDGSHLLHKHKHDDQELRPISRYQSQTANKEVIRMWYVYRNNSTSCPFMEADVAISVDQCKLMPLSIVLLVSSRDSAVS